MTSTESLNDAGMLRSEVGGRGCRGWWPWMIAAALAFICAMVVLLVQVDVSDSATGVTRSCGSAFDTTVDRSGWEQWWARDLDEPDAAVRTVLLRTNSCPNAINQRIVVSGALAALGAIAAVVGVRRIRPPVERSAAADTAVSTKIRRLGRTTFMAGALLTIAGVVAITVLVADSESTLFLYTDRLVVAVVGLIVLVPTMAMLAIGRALSIVGQYLEEGEKDRQDA